MTINASLPISSLVNVTASLATTAAQAQSTQTMLILGNSAVIDVVSRMREYTSATAVATDFGANAPETAAAVIWFEQSPQPTSLYVGRWAQSATSGQLFGSTLTATQQLISTWQAITDGAFTIAVDAGAATDISGLNFSGVANMNGVAGVIQAKLTGAVIVWDSVNSRFVITSDTTGATSAISFATAGTGTGVTDVSSMLGLTAASSGAYQAAGIVAESALAAVTIFDERFGQQWYGLSILGAQDADVSAVWPFLSASSNKHFFFPSTQESGVITSTSTTDIAYVLSQAAATKTALQYSSSNPYSAISMAARILTVDWSASASAITLFYKQEPGITAETLTSTQAATLIAKNCNALLAYNNGASIIQPGICCDGNYVDTIVGADALVLAIQTAVFNLLYKSTTKIPQTDAGMNQIKAAIQAVLEEFVSNGYIAPGTWNGPLFGSLQNGSDGTPPTLSTGYYIYQPTVASQSEAGRTSRVSVPFQIAVKLAGAVHTVNVAITLNN